MAYHALVAAFVEKYTMIVPLLAMERLSVDEELLEGADGSDDSDG